MKTGSILCRKDKSDSKQTVSADRSFNENKCLQFNSIK